MKSELLINKIQKTGYEYCICQPKVIGLANNITRYNYDGN